MCPVCCPAKLHSWKFKVLMMRRKRCFLEMCFVKCKMQTITACFECEGNYSCSKWVDALIHLRHGVQLTCSFGVNSLVNDTNLEVSDLLGSKAYCAANYLPAVSITFTSIMLSITSFLLSRVSGPARYRLQFTSLLFPGSSSTRCLATLIGCNPYLTRTQKLSPSRWNF